MSREVKSISLDMTEGEFVALCVTMQNYKFEGEEVDPGDYKAQEESHNSLKEKVEAIARRLYATVWYKNKLT